jgi:hypothetical protein
VVSDKLAGAQGPGELLLLFEDLQSQLPTDTALTPASGIEMSQSNGNTGLPAAAVGGVRNGTDDSGGGVVVMPPARFFLTHFRHCEAVVQLVESLMQAKASKAAAELRLVQVRQQRGAPGIGSPLVGSQAALPQSPITATPLSAAAAAAAAAGSGSVDEDVSWHTRPFLPQHQLEEALSEGRLLQVRCNAASFPRVSDLIIDDETPSVWRLDMLTHGQTGSLVSLVLYCFQPGPESGVCCVMLCG